MNLCSLVKYTPEGTQEGEKLTPGSPIESLRVDAGAFRESIVVGQKGVESLQAVYTEAGVCRASLAPPSKSSLSKLCNKFARLHKLGNVFPRLHLVLSRLIHGAVYASDSTLIWSIPSLHIALSAAITCYGAIMHLCGWLPMCTS